ncbi:hypothetical protein GCM10010464_04350 [Pseudonocardia yunnanensis]|uniref:Uncharacterized protein n=1 Tax=Pseudonocardia yunnanensis TaxID=58107 RepID=A0ABW4ETC9_9PSEU
MARTRTHGRTRGRLGFGRRSGRTTPGMGAVEFFTRPEQNVVLQVLGFIVRIRAELLVATIIVVVFVQLRDLFTPDDPASAGGVDTTDPTSVTDGSGSLDGGSWAVITMVALALLTLAIPVSRRYLVRRGWCVTTRHRMRSCFAQTRTMTHHGRMPFLWWSRPSPVGERVRVWLPAGLSVKDLERVTAELATACWAREVRVTGSRSQAASVVVEVVRRDPLASSTVLTPAVINDLDTDKVDGDDNEGVITPLPDRASLRPVPPADPHSAPAAGGPRSTRKTPATVPARTNGASTSGTPDDSDDPVTGFGGVDVSDYV